MLREFQAEIARLKAELASASSGGIPAYVPASSGAVAVGQPQVGQRQACSGFVQ